MRRLCLVLFGFALMLIATGCCSHEWKEATCVTPKTCVKCGETEGEPFGHKWTEATCTEPRLCLICGETEGNPLGHKWIEATCTEAKKCSVCGQTEGNPAGHKWIEATCTEAKKCSVCGETEGDPAGHKWENATLSKPKTCKICGLIEGEPLECSYFSMDTHEFVRAYNNSEHALGTLKTDYNVMTIDGTSVEIIFLVYDVSEETGVSHAMWAIPQKNFNQMHVRIVDHRSNNVDENYLKLICLAGYTFAEVLDPTFEISAFLDECDKQKNGKDFTLSYMHNGYEYKIEGDSLSDPSSSSLNAYYYDFIISLSANGEANEWWHG